MKLRNYCLALICLFFSLTASAAYLVNVPRTVKQPDGTELHCFISGDEFYCRLHDAEGYTIVQNPQTGFFVYAELRQGKVVPTNWVAGTCNPAQKGLRPNVKISQKEYQTLRKRALEPAFRSVIRDANTNKGNMNNIVIFIRFADDSMFANSFQDVQLMFNDSSDNYHANSMFDYFKATSYNQLFIRTSFFPEADGDQIISYQDSFPRGYFMPWSETNPLGYLENDTIQQRTQREHDMLARAIDYVQNMIPSSLNIDYNNDGYVDNVCFVIKGDVGDWNVLLWPHRWSLFTQDVYLNGKRVYDYNLQLADAGGYFTNSVMCHEMFHTLGAPDLYHYNDSTNMDPVGSWDLMCANQNPPQQTCAYMKYKYGNWITSEDILPADTFGTYTLMPLNSSSIDRLCYRIPTESPFQFIIAEFRNKDDGYFDTSVPGRGIIFYRINALYDGNASYNGNDALDEIYVFRRGGTTTTNGTISRANFRGDIAARRNFNPTTDPYPFLSMGETCQLYFGNFTSGHDSMSFDLLDWTGVDEVEAVSYSLYPNPTHDQITISTPEAEQTQLQIFNAMGQMLQTELLQSTHSTIDVTDYPTGVYFVKIFENQKYKGTIKFIKH